MVATQPFSASASVMAGQVVAGDVQLQVTFSNVPAMTAGQDIHLATGGTPVATVVTPDPMDPRKLTVAPTTWTPGASYTLTVDTDAVDLFGVKAGRGAVGDLLGEGCQRRGRRSRWCRARADASPADAAADVAGEG
jgi:hypothetical protein